MCYSHSVFVTQIYNASQRDCGNHHGHASLYLNVTHLGGASQFELENQNALLSFEEKGDLIHVRPKMYLGQDKWKAVMAIVQKFDGEWNTAGKNSDWTVPKE